MARYLKLKAIWPDELKPLSCSLVAIGMSVPTRIVACRLFNVSTLGRDKTSAFPSRTRAFSWTAQFLLISQALSKSKLTVFGAVPAGATEPTTVSKLPSRNCHSTPNSDNPSSLISSTIPSTNICLVGRSMNSASNCFTRLNCSGCAGW